ncbi:hypothetical protein CAMGR0001_2213 [Campylobacter gracilis RM3268]|uniref:Uncharacterized protein n=1 Tax=Campylobacter gracilis RM3268 TaxID=553220 RepID=C8PH25_9BACT|nr:hypothetical protein CAMGR0001_2213 [Campylobacter gracilis RM3268]
MSLRHLQNFKTARNLLLQTTIAPRAYLFIYAGSGAFGGLNTRPLS